MFITYQINLVVVQGLSSIVVGDYKPDANLLRASRMDEFSDSFNIIFGSVNPDFDFFNNPYVEINV